MVDVKTSEKGVMSPLSCQRHAFNIDPIHEGHIWLNSAFMGPIPTIAVRRGLEALNTRAFPVSLTPNDFFHPAEQVRGAIAKLINTDKERVAYITTVSSAMAIVARNLTPISGQNIVLLGEQFPSNVYPWFDWVREGVEIRTVKAPRAPWSGRVSSQRSRAEEWNEAIFEAIDQDTALVSIEQAHWTDGTLFDLHAISHACQKFGAAFVIDATQTAGAMPLDYDQIRPDALIVHCYKSMLSNYGLGFAAFSDRFAGGTPIEQSWLMREGSDDFARLVDYQHNYAAGMRRFDTSLRANPLLISMLGASVDLLLEWKPERIREYLLNISRGFVSSVREMGFEVADEDNRAANLFGLKMPEGIDPNVLRTMLTERRIHVAVRGDCVRVSPHVYNDASELNLLSKALADLM